jgi:hypothetical protein
MVTVLRGGIIYAWPWIDWRQRMWLVGLPDRRLLLIAILLRNKIVLGYLIEEMLSDDE